MLPKAERYQALDAIRGLSALVVCSGHLRAALLPDFRDLQHYRALFAPFYFVTGLGHQAVMVFFVLSGFLVGGSVLKAPLQFSLRRYAIARLCRLWVVLIPALGFTLLVDTLISSYDPSVLTGTHYGQWNSGPSPQSPADHSLATALGNLVFVQTILIPVFGSNGPLWSLANEFWYYVLFPLLVIACGLTASRVAIRALCALGVGGVFFFLPGEIAVGFAYWCFGVLAWWISSRVAKGKRLVEARVLTGLLFATSLALKSVSIPLLHSDLLVALSFAAFAATVSTVEVVGGKATRHATRVLSEISYSLYSFHFPVVVLLGVLLSPGIEANVTGVMLYAASLIAIVLLSGGLWWIFERRTEVVRRWALTQLGKTL